MKYTAYFVTAQYFPGNDRTRRCNDTGMAMADEINKKAAAQDEFEREWFERQIADYDPEGLWGLALDSEEVEVDD